MQRTHFPPRKHSIKMNERTKKHTKSKESQHFGGKGKAERNWQPTILTWCQVASCMLHVVTSWIYIRYMYL